EMPHLSDPEGEPDDDLGEDPEEDGEPEKPSEPETGNTNARSSREEFCEDLRMFSLRIGGIADLATLPVSSEDVADMFDLIDPYLNELPDGAPEQVEVLRAATQQAADKTADDAADILDDPDLRQASDGMDDLYAMYCVD